MNQRNLNISPRKKTIDRCQIWEDTDVELSDKNFKAAIINQTLSSKGEYIWNEWKTRMSVKKWIHKKNQMEI